ncbi:MAG: hypothetical protein J6T44_02700 [Prevotella sp.]|nr:hypothetical protein [Prevotella sp.]MBO7538174.1 hypothetical protein [Prevotella sp.]
MRLNRATTEDYESIIAFYDDVTDRILRMSECNNACLYSCVPSVAGDQRSSS